ncbi:MAG: adenylate/guanylate cyclase domain-containing protein [Hyphomonadaceae bacterium]
MEKRKLATILSLDVVGYSAAAEKDDAAAAASVRTLRAAIEAIVSPFSGRIFSSAGDGFMVEFPVASAGVQAGMALLEACQSPVQPLPNIRIGMHLGEVIVEANGDLLGHGVNIAARLQQRALPGAMIVSQDVRNSVRGEAAELLKPLGTIKLDKMVQRLAIYGFGSGAMLRPIPRDPRRLLIGVGVVGLALVAVIVAFNGFTVRSDSARTAVFALQAAGDDAEARALAGGIANEIVDTMSEIGLEPVARSETNVATDQSRLDRAKDLNAVYALDGDIVRDGDNVRVSVRLDDVGAHQTVWAQTFERNADRMEGLRFEVAASAVRVLRCASDARRERARLRHAPIATLLRICEVSADSGNAERLRLARELVRAAPNSSLAHGRLAIESANAWQVAPEALSEQLLHEASDAADNALRLNAHNGAAAAVKAFVLAGHQTRVERERTLLGFLQNAPDSPELNTLYATFLREVGRNQDSVAYLERAFAFEPLSPYRASSLVRQLSVVGRGADAQALLTRTTAMWPEDSGVSWERFRMSFYFGTEAETRRILAESSIIDSEDRACWRAALQGRAAASVAARRSAAAQVRRCLADDPGQAVQVLAVLGDTDGAFAFEDGVIRQDGSHVFFVPATRALRLDPRFMPVMDRIGLLDYWLQSDHWPDFCTDPQLRYDCRAEAARLAAN